MTIRDIEFNDGFIYVAAYSEVNKSLFAMYDTSGSLHKFFGNFFDTKINELTNRRLSNILYSSILLNFNNDSLYALFEYLPIVQVYNKKGILIRVINVSIKEVQKIYKHNTDQHKVIEGQYFYVKGWIRGAFVTDDKMYCYSPMFKGILVLDHHGNLIENIPIARRLKEYSFRAKTFVHMENLNFIFTDLLDAEIEIYKLVKK